VDAIDFKIAVYTIALNEEKFVGRWYESAKDADLLVIADTGSNDKTVQYAQNLGIKVESIKVDPWRFDVARNLNLEMIPEDFDICIQLDMDEVLPDGWRSVVEDSFRNENNWPTYKHVTKRNPDGSAHTYQMYFKIHPRKGFKWKYPIHEVLTPDAGVVFSRNEIELEVDHLQDRTKDRSSYLGLLETAVSESPKDWRMNHYLVREYWYLKEWDKILKGAHKVELISGGWDVERSSTYMWAAEAAYKLGYLGWATEWADKAIWAAPKFYEAKWLRAQIAHWQGDWETCFKYAIQVETHKRQDHHLVLPHIWEWMAFDLIALSAYKTNKRETAIYFGEKAAIAQPENERLQKNLKYYKGEL
jgi:glycosyltransferase involved in cell wall biosynthesis